MPPRRVRQVTTACAIVDADVEYSGPAIRAVTNTAPAVRSGRLRTGPEQRSV